MASEGSEKHPGEVAGETRGEGLGPLPAAVDAVEEDMSGRREGAEAGARLAGGRDDEGLAGENMDAAASTEEASNDTRTLLVPPPLSYPTNTTATEASTEPEPSLAPPPLSTATNTAATEDSTEPEPLLAPPISNPTASSTTAPSATVSTSQEPPTKTVPSPPPASTAAHTQVLPRPPPSDALQRTTSTESAPGSPEHLDGTATNADAHQEQNQEKPQGEQHSPTSLKTVLLVFIHGFKGDDKTFCEFPQDLAKRVQEKVAKDAAARFPGGMAPVQPPPRVQPLLYPSFATRGDLSAAVDRFRAWLLEKVIDAEVSLGTASPTVNPGVGVIIVGHSMGGIVGAEAALGIAEDAGVISSATTMTGESDGDGDKGGTNMGGDAEKEEDPTQMRTMFPHILGLLAFDTPFLGIAPGVVRWNAEHHWKEGKSWYDNTVGIFNAVSQGKQEGRAAREGLSSASNASTGSAGSTAANAASSGGGWSKWTKYGLLAAGTAAVGAGAAYASRQHISEGFSWVGEHMEFVGCLARGEELKGRWSKIHWLSNEDPSQEYQPEQETQSQKRERGKIGLTVYYTALSDPSKKPSGDEERTFVNLPAELRKQNRPVDHNSYVWVRAPNAKAKNEVDAHVGMFAPATNDEYESLLTGVVERIGSWV